MMSVAETWNVCHEEVEGDDLSVQAQAGFQDFAHEVEGDDQLRPKKLKEMI